MLGYTLPRERNINCPGFLEVMNLFFTVLCFLRNVFFFVPIVLIFYFIVLVFCCFLFHSVVFLLFFWYFLFLLLLAWYDISLFPWFPFAWWTCKINMTFSCHLISSSYFSSFSSSLSWVVLGRTLVNKQFKWNTREAWIWTWFALSISHFINR